MTRVYGLIDPRTGLLRYIGVSRRPLCKRLAVHICESKCGAQSHRCRWIRQILACGLRPRIVEIECCPVTDGRQEERYHIALAKQDGIRLVNSTDGGDGIPGLQHSEKTRRLLSEQRKGIRWTDERRSQRRESIRSDPDRLRALRERLARVRDIEAVIRSNKRRKNPDGTKPKRPRVSPELAHINRSQAQKRRPRTQAEIDRIRFANIGRTFSAEWRQNMSEAGKRRQFTEKEINHLRQLAASQRGKKRASESIEKQRRKMLGRRQSPEHVAKRMAARRETFLKKQLRDSECSVEVR
jgi:hypothetical protein